MSAEIKPTFFYLNRFALTLHGLFIFLSLSTFGSVPLPLVPIIVITVQAVEFYFPIADGCDTVPSNISDVYIINVAPTGELPQYKNIFCDMTTDGGGWTVNTLYCYKALNVM